ncbi:hypothetical protein DFQ27_006524 [Actinomortierella ambigua]|uniref:Uncharacterized protein n=1 Tax=Actinomortierella ambigua TaxID=1343610 RepID=A0A9P6PVI4_9FUNG|nr:hypothetical protein DFQ27_006524 [Actinomortierella ambigua]
MAGVISAQDANCTAVYNDFTPGLNGKYQKCYTKKIYDTDLVNAGATPNYKDLITKVCSVPSCTPSTIKTATDTYLKACNASIASEATNSGFQILQLGKNALEIFFAEPIHNIYCGEDLEALKLQPTPSPTPGTTPPKPEPIYCLGATVANPSMRFQTQLALYLTQGSLRANQGSFFMSLAKDDVCSDCSKRAVNTTAAYLTANLMPGIAFYTPEFVQYWTKFVPEYNKYCVASITPTVWPAGTLNVTTPNLPPPSTVLPTTSASPTASNPAPSKTPSSAFVVRPSAAGLLAVVAAMAAYL